MNPAIADLKVGERIIEQPDSLSQLLCNVFADKGIAPATVQYLLDSPTSAAALGQLLGHCVIRSPYAAGSRSLQQSILSCLWHEPHYTYYGTVRENVEIDSAVADSSDSSGYRESIRDGSTQYFSLYGCRLPAHRPRLRQTPIIVLGAGAAGTLITRTLVNAGYQHIFVVDARDSYGGIWNQKNVFGGSRNNPIPLGYEQFRVDAAPGAGSHITSFLASLAHPPRSLGIKPLPAIHKATVTKVMPGDLLHRVIYCDKDGEHLIEAPLVFNTLGLGKPLPPSRPGVMTTDVPASSAGIRWQQILTPEQVTKMPGKTLVFIGLGNSTAEMLVQIQHYREAGFDLRYKILTHYPGTSLRYPYDDEHLDGKSFRLYRDTERPRLTKLAGDLPHIERAFLQARDSRDKEQEEIIPSVKHWTMERVEGRQIMTVTLADGDERSFPCDQLYTLIGYGHRKEELLEMGMWVMDEYLGTIAYDYDGEIQRLPGSPGRPRLYPGYFALGAPLYAPHNPNALVIPGMLFRLSDLYSSVVFRSAEWAMQKAAQPKAKELAVVTASER
jgi:hypothetical protein